MKLTKLILMILLVSVMIPFSAQQTLGGFAGCKGDPIACAFQDLDPKAKGIMTLDGIIKVFWEPLLGDYLVLGGNPVYPDCWDGDEDATPPEPALGCSDNTDLSYAYFDIELNVGKDKTLFFYEADLGDVECSVFPATPDPPTPEQYCDCRKEYVTTNIDILPAAGLTADQPKAKVPVCAIEDLDFQGVLLRKFLSEKALPHALKGLPESPPTIDSVQFTWTSIKSISWNDQDPPKNAIFKFQLVVTDFTE